MAENNRKQTKIQKVVKKAGDYEELIGNCAQAPLVALQEEFHFGGGIELLKAAIFFPGIASHKEICGALLGGLMALGLAYSRNNILDPNWNTPEAVEKYYSDRKKAFYFCEAFKKEFGSIKCGDIRPLLMGRDYDTLNNLEDRKQFIEDGGRKKCRIPPETVTRLVMEILLEDKKLHFNFNHD
jgi:C_GCAxxG_C_C family probable redox protein